MIDEVPVTEAEFLRRVEALPDEALREFVAALWEESGWTVERGAGRLTVTRGGERRTIAIREGADADAVVTPDGAVSRDVETIDAADLYERARYALDRETRAEVLSTHLHEPDRPRGAIAAIRAAVAGGLAPGADGEERRSPPVWLVAAVAAAVLVAAAAAGTGAIADGVGGLGDDETPTGTPAPTPALAADTDGPSTGGGDGGSSTAVTPSRVPGSSQPRYRNLTPTCERPPELVVAIVVGALRNDDGTGAGIRTAWAFGIHQPGSSYASFESFIRSDEFAPLFTYRRATYGRTVTRNGVVVQPVTVTGPGGREASYDFYLARESRMRECWRIASVVREFNRE